MLALYRSGRQADALEAYREARLALVEELGIEPGRELRDLEQAILRQEAALELVSAPPGAPGARSRRLRRAASRELAELLACLDAALAGRGAGWSSSPASPGSARAGWRASSRRGPGSAARGCSRDAAGRPAGTRLLAVGAVAARLPRGTPAQRRCARSWARAPRSSHRCSPSCARSCPTCPPPPSLESEGARFRLFDATATLPAQRGAAPRRSCWCSTTSTRPTRRRCCSSSSSPARSRTRGSWSWAPTARSSLRGDHPLRGDAGRARAARRPRGGCTLGGLTEPDVSRFLALTTERAMRPSPGRGDPRPDRGQPAVRRARWSGCSRPRGGSVGLEDAGAPRSRRASAR